MLPSVTPETLHLFLNDSFKKLQAKGQHNELWLYFFRQLKVFAQDNLGALLPYSDKLNASDLTISLIGTFARKQLLSSSHGTGETKPMVEKAIELLGTKSLFTAPILRSLILEEDKKTFTWKVESTTEKSRSHCSSFDSQGGEEKISHEI